MHTDRSGEFLAALCLFKEGEEEGRRLFHFAPSSREGRLKEISQKESLTESLPVKQTLSRQVGLEEIHPGWIVETLEGESPRVLGLLCRSLSGSQVRSFLDLLPERMRQKLPKVNESYRVSPDVVEWVRRWVEKKFCFPVAPSMEGGFSLSHMVFMKTGDLQAVFRDLGLEEIRKAFNGVDSSMLRPFLARFRPQIAREIRDRIELGEAVSTSERFQAQKHIVSLSLEEFSADQLFREVGYSVFARALTSTDLSWAKILYHKLPPHEGHRLKRLFKEVRPASDSDKKSPKEAILDRIRVLSEKGQIRRYWKDEKNGKSD